MSPALQAKLLRVTQGGRFQRIGSNREVNTNARILAASNRILEDEVKAGRFREDLFYRLERGEVNIPPLRERREDILPLARNSSRNWPRAARGFPRPWRSVWKITPGRAMCESCVTPWSARRCSPAAKSFCRIICPPACVPPANTPRREAGEQERLDEIERQAILPPCASTVATAPKPPRPSESAGAHSSTNFRNGASSDSTAIKID